jgi:transglutaminase-like putative cysteine protease
VSWGEAAKIALYGYLAYDATRKLVRSRRERGRGRLGDSERREGGLRSKFHEVRTIDQRVSHIQRLAHSGKTDPVIVQLARQTVSRRCGDKHCIPERDYAGEVSAIFHEVRRRVRYVRDAWGVDQFSSARRTLEAGAGDCDDFSIIISSMLGAVGYQTRLRVIRTTDSPEWNHIYNLVEVPPGSDRWFPLDASVNEPPGWQAPRAQIAAIRDYEVK